MNEAKPYGSNVGVVPVLEDWDFRNRLSAQVGMRKAADRAKERRERIATAVLAGFAASDTAVDGDKAPAVAVRWADTLIAELDK